MFSFKIKQVPILALVILSIVVMSFAAYSTSPKLLPVSNKLLNIENYFAGKSKAYGILFDRGGAAQRYFSVDLLGTWSEENQTLTLEEDFIFNDGEKSHRTWVINKVSANQYTGKADDVLGEAKGFSEGNAFHWDYVLQVPYKGSTLALTIDDWLFLSDDDVLINRAEMYKFGFKVGEIVISFNKL